MNYNDEAPDCWQDRLLIGGLAVLLYLWPLWILGALQLCVRMMAHDYMGG